MRFCVFLCFFFWLVGFFADVPISTNGGLTACAAALFRDVGGSCSPIGSMHGTLGSSNKDELIHNIPRQRVGHSGPYVGLGLRLGAEKILEKTVLVVLVGGTGGCAPHTGGLQLQAGGQVAPLPLPPTP